MFTTTITLKQTGNRMSDVIFKLYQFEEKKKNSTVLNFDK